MANFGTSQNNDKDNQVSVNTKAYQFMNREGFEPSSLTVGSWNENLSLRINPMLEPSKQSDNRVFDYDRFVTTALTLEKAMLLLYRIEKDLLPAVESGEDKSIGIQVGGDSLLVVGTGKRLTGSIRPFLAIHKSLNPDTKKPELSMFYEFRSASSIDDYDETTGSYKISDSVYTEFKVFVNLLKSFINLGGNFTAHASKYNDRFYNTKLLNSVTAIGQKVGAQLPGGNNGSYGNSFKRGNIFSQPSSNNTPSISDADMTDIGDINDLNEYMNS